MKYKKVSFPACTHRVPCLPACLPACTHRVPCLHLQGSLPACIYRLPCPACREYNRADTNSRRNRDREERDRLRAIEREDRDRRRLEAMHAKRYPIDDLDLIAEQRHRSSYSSGSSSMLVCLFHTLLH